MLFSRVVSSYLFFIISFCILILFNLDHDKILSGKKISTNNPKIVKSTIIFMIIFATVAPTTFSIGAIAPKIEFPETTDQKIEELQHLYRKADFSKEVKLSGRPAAIDKRIVIKIKCEIYPRAKQTDINAIDSQKNLNKREKDIEKNTKKLLLRIHNYNAKHKQKYSPKLALLPKSDIQLPCLKSNYNTIDKLLDETIVVLGSKKTPYKKIATFNMVDSYTWEIIKDLSEIELIQKSTNLELRIKESEFRKSEKLISEAETFLMKNGF